MTRLEDDYPFSSFEEDEELAEMLEQEQQHKIELLEEFYARVEEECE